MKITLINVGLMLTVASVFLFGNRAVQAATLIDFDLLVDSEVVDDQFLDSGIDFNGSAGVLSLNQLLNPLFPPRSGTNVIYDATFLGSLIRADAVGGGWSRFSAYITGNRPITLTAFSPTNQILDTAMTPAANYEGAESGLLPNLRLEVTGPDIAYVTVRGTGNSFTVDDVSFERQSTPPAIPSPALLPGLLGMGAAALRRKRTAEGTDWESGH